MKIITGLLATAALVGGIAVASAQQTPSQKMDEEAGGTNQAVERNPSGAPAGSKTNPSPTVGAGESRPTPGGVNAAERAVRWREPGHRAQSGRINRRLKNQPVAVTELRVDLRRGRGKPRFTSGFGLLRL
jgi:hypothetical protein